MIDLARQIRELSVPTGSLGIFWLGQAGFVFKTPTGKIVYTDPYLTASVQQALPEYGFGFKRLMASLVEPEEVEADYVISTHAHADHFDTQAVPVIARSPRPHFIGAPDCQELYGQAGVPGDRVTILHTGERLDLDGFQLTGVYADHGELAPDASGVVVRIWWNHGLAGGRQRLPPESLAGAVRTRRGCADPPDQRRFWEPQRSGSCQAGGGSACPGGRALPFLDLPAARRRSGQVS